MGKCTRLMRFDQKTIHGGKGRTLHHLRLEHGVVVVHKCDPPPPHRSGHRQSRALAVLIDVGAALVWTSGSSAGIVLYREAVMLIVGIACAAIGRCVLPLEVAWRAHLASRNARLRRNYSGGRAARA